MKIEYNDEYVQNKRVCCPRCGGLVQLQTSYIKYYFTKMDIRQLNKCKFCNAEWVDVYEFKGQVITKEGIDVSKYSNGNVN